eukprot:1190067-Prorocentrum_minimum.AAC.1
MLPYFLRRLLEALLGHFRRGHSWKLTVEHPDRSGPRAEGGISATRDVQYPCQHSSKTQHAHTMSTP